MPFFVNPKTKKRKFQQRAGQDKGTKIKKNKKALAEEISSDSEVDSNEASETRAKYYSSDEEEETAQQKRLRLAKEYLSHLEEEATEKGDDSKSMKDAVSDRLQHDISQHTGKQIKEVADQCSCPSTEDLQIFRGHKLSVTAVVISPDDKYVFTASKDCNICKWDLQSGLKVKTIKGGRKGTEDTHIGHTDHILCMSMSSDGKFLAAGDMNNMIKLWNPDNCSFIYKFKGHRGPVTGVTFRSGTHMLYSCSADKSVKVWSVDDMAYVETLYGHNGPITSINSLCRERAVTSGGRDRSIHIWKIPEDSQLLFYGHEGSIECVSLINEGNFFSGGDDSSLCLWSVLKKKPLVTKHHAHGVSNGHRSEDWISAVAAYQYSDLVASGSKDGFVRLWKCSNNFKTLSPLFTVPVKGFVNSLCFSNNGQFLVVGVGQEHRLGRWWNLKDAKNGWMIIPLKNKDKSNSDSSEDEEDHEDSDEDHENNDQDYEDSEEDQEESDEDQEDSDENQEDIDEDNESSEEDKEDRDDQKKKCVEEEKNGDEIEVDEMNSEIANEDEEETSNDGDENDSEEDGKKFEVGMKDCVDDMENNHDRDIEKSEEDGDNCEEDSDNSEEDSDNSEEDSDNSEEDMDNNKEDVEAIENDSDKEEEAS